jgi:4-hydroxy-3-polyprenylbenzoate decarboxylase
MFDDINAFIAELDRRKELARIADAVSPDLEMAAVIDRVSKSPGGGPALLFEQAAGYDMPVAANLFGSMTRMCLALGVESLDDVAREVDRLMTPPQPKGFMHALKLMPLANRLTDLMPKTVKDAPCQEVVKTEGGLDELPILKTWPDDGGAFITLPLVITRDPETGMRNIGTYRMQVFDRQTTGMHWQRHKGGAQHHRVAERLGQRLEVAVALGADPVLTYAATAPMPEGLDELMLAGVLGKRRVELVKCRTLDLEVPANAQIVLEGYVEPDERRREGPFGDHTGHYSMADEYPHDRRGHSADGGLLPGHGQRADLPAADSEDAARDRRHAFSGGRHLPQHRAGVDRQAIPRARPQDHERLLGPWTADVLEVHRRRRQGRRRSERGGGRLDCRHPRRPRARHRDRARPG